ncbi:MAG: hypothetical protein K9L87_01590 [Candidatus Omnitrophica bacterium]|nr:hypothetical protein [Candidatus Omnitrophota bacterium]MCF7892177.1 hypothetical protein [Candidatus Omnitrophota bacterium]MCF7897431.1 hypothetical protein [Candidatus Omnitrophota bacterium]MCF7909391.1 hypothetical protein [Candidatus Omnitrophota bacterium]
MQNEKTKKLPKGIVVLGVLIIILGVVSLINHINLDYYRYRDSLEKIGQGEISSQISQSQVKTINTISLIFSGFLLFAGVGILYHKEKARKALVYFSAVIVIAFLLAAAIHPSSIVFLFPQFLLFSIVILYFTNKDVKKIFAEKRKGKNSNQ